MTAARGPGISVVIPARDEEATIPAILASLMDQAGPEDEVIVADTGSVDRTRAIVRSWVETHPRISLVELPAGHPGDARNAGVERARNEWVALLDAGTEVGQGWLAAFRTAIGDVPDAYASVAFAGTFDPVVGGSFEAASALAYVPRRRPDGTRGPSTASMMLHRDTWRRSGGFISARAGEDLAFFMELDRLGIRFHPVPSAVVRWHLAPDWSSTWRRFRSYSYHVLDAGLWRTWHLGLARHLIVIGAFSVVGAMMQPLAWVGIPIWYAARAVKSAQGKWDDVAGAPKSRVRLVVRAGLLIAFIDLAAVWGAARWLGRSRAGG